MKPTMVPLLAAFLLNFVSQFAQAEPHTQEAKVVSLGIADVKALLPPDSKVGDCVVAFVPSKNITGGTDIIIKDAKTGEQAIKTFNPNYKRNIIQKVLDLGQENVDGISTYPHSLVGGNGDPKEIDKNGWINFYGDAKNNNVENDGLTSRKLDLTFYYDDRTQRITGLEYRDMTGHLFSKSDMNNFLACGNIKAKETQRVKEEYNVKAGAVGAKN